MVGFMGGGDVWGEDRPTPIIQKHNKVKPGGYEEGKENSMQMAGQHIHGSQRHPKRLRETDVKVNGKNHEKHSGGVSQPDCRILGAMAR